MQRCAVSAEKEDLSVTKAILDSNIVIDLLHQHTDAINWFSSFQMTPVAITPIIWMEVVEGARNVIEKERIIRFLKRFQIEHPTTADNNWAMAQFSQFRLSHYVDWEDTMIASVAVRLSVPLYTLNVRHFRVLPGVDVRKPY